MMFSVSSGPFFTELLPQQNSRPNFGLPGWGWNQEQNQCMHTVLDRIRSRCWAEAVMKASELRPMCEDVGWQCFSTREKPEVDVKLICIWKRGLSISGMVCSYRIGRITAWGFIALQNPALNNRNAFTLAIVTAKLLVVKLTQTLYSLYYCHFSTWYAF